MPRSCATGEALDILDDDDDDEASDKPDAWNHIVHIDDINIHIHMTSYG